MDCVQAILSEQPYTTATVIQLAKLLQAAKDNHPPEDQDWPSWYARFIHARLHGKSTPEAAYIANEALKPKFLAKHPNDIGNGYIEASPGKPIEDGWKLYPGRGWSKDGDCLRPDSDWCSPVELRELDRWADEGGSVPPESDLAGTRTEEAIALAKDYETDGMEGESARPLWRDRDLPLALQSPGYL